MTSKPSLSFKIWPLLVILTVFILDQFSKELILSYPTNAYGIITPVIDNLFYIVCWFNTGGAWGILSNHTEILTLISLFFGIFLCVKFNKIHENHKGNAFALALLIGGIWGNFFDRAFRLSTETTLRNPVDMFINQWDAVCSGATMWGRGHVVDFIYFCREINGKRYDYPAFNIADIGICVGVALLILFAFLPKCHSLTQKENKNPEDSEK